MARVLFIQTAFLGDVILATGLVERWKQAFPDDEVDFLLRRGNEGVLAGNPHLRKVLVWNKQRGKFPGLIRIIREVRRQRYDQVFNLQRFAATGWIAVLSGAHHTVGFKKNPLSFFFSEAVEHVIGGADGLHEVERNHRLIQSQVGVQFGLPKLYPSDPAQLTASLGFSGPYITVSPASVWFTKQLPAVQWVQMLAHLPNGLAIVILGSASDRLLGERIRSELQQLRDGQPFYNLCGQLGIGPSAAVMQRAVMNYANDSAPLHMASAVNAPVSAVFCSTVPSFGFGPLSERSFVVQTEEQLPCRPCGLHGRKSCPEGHFRCATSISTEALLRPLQVVRS
ncbi:MAG: glycosyltransferase family 9 protein [Saprospiraceae bacterium]|nr:glycosyltransferase family 9 protein [Saprospiraceae bacterium]